MAPLVREQAALIGRIRDALGALGYPVPAGRGPGTLDELVLCIPHIESFVRSMGGHFERAVRAASSSDGRARLVAERAEEVVATLGPTGAAFLRIARGFADGFALYRKMNSDLSSIASFAEHLTAAKSR